MTAEIKSIPLYIHQGATFKRTITFLDDNNSPVDITDWQFYMQIRSSEGGILLIDLESETPTGITVDGANGQIEIEITGAQTATLSKNCKYDLCIINADSDPYYPFKGDVVLSRRTTIPVPPVPEP